MSLTFRVPMLRNLIKLAGLVTIRTIDFQNSSRIASRKTCRYSEVFNGILDIDSDFFVGPS